MAVYDPVHPNGDGEKSQTLPKSGIKWPRGQTKQVKAKPSVRRHTGKK